MPRGPRRLPERCTEELARADMIVHLGDFSVLEVLEALRAYAPVQGVHGNVDSAEIRRALPARTILEAGGVKLGLIHDAGPRQGRLRRMRREFPDVDAVLFGHSHMPLHEREGSFQIFNPGSPTERRRAPARSMGVAEVRGGSVTLRHVTLG